MEGCFIEADVQHPEDLHNLHNDLTFFLERTIIAKMEKFVANFRDKEEYVIRIRDSKSRLNHGLVFNKIHRNIKFNQKAWLKPYININIDLRKNAKNDFEKRFFSIMSNLFFGKTVENMKKI